MARNPEWKWQTAGMVILALLGSVLGFLQSTAAGLITALTALALIGLFQLSNHRRYRTLSSFSRNIALILDGKEQLDLRAYQEGELSILNGQIQKMTLRLRQQADALRADKQYLADSLADISHQIRTPLTAANLSLACLADPELPVEQRRQSVRALQQQLERMDWLISALLKLSKLDAGTVQFQKSSCSARGLLEKASQPLLIAMELRQQQLVLHAAPGVQAAVDADWTAEALTNVLKNCMEHTPRGGTITVDAEQTPLYTAFVISDTGPGIAPEDLPHLFERFYKGKGAKSESVGIGLALARRIAAAQDGTLKAENTMAGGAKFTMKFYKQRP